MAVFLLLSPTWQGNGGVLCSADIRETPSLCDGDVPAPSVRPPVLSVDVYLSLCSAAGSATETELR